MPNPQPPSIPRARGRPAEAARAPSARGARSAAGPAPASATLRPSALEDPARGREAHEAASPEIHGALDGLAALGKELAASRDRRSLLQAVIDAAIDASGASFGAILYRDEPAPVPAKEGGADAAARPETGVDAPAPAPMIAFAGVAQADSEPFDPARAAAAFDAAWGGRTLRCPDVSALETDEGDERLDPALALEAPVRSFLAVPVTRRGGAVAGGLFLAHPEAALFNARTEHIVEGLAAQAGIALDNLRLEEGLRRAAAERRELVDAARRARAESARAVHIKDEFLSTLSHELRTPLTAILGWAKVLLLQRADAATQSRGLEAIERNANAQAELIETLLDMSRIVSGKVRLDVQPTDLGDVIAAALEAIRPAAEAKSITLVRSVEPAACPVSGDPVRLQQMLWNLLSNAVKFTPRQGRVEIALARVEDEVEIVVSDTGVGIGPTFLPHVFDCFRQGDASTTRRHGGLGLGLAIVKQLATLHGGTVGVRSDGAGQGASFIVRLPCVATRQARTTPQREPVREPRCEPHAGAFCDTDLRGLDLLVVDDQTDARELISQLLVECGATVRQAASAAEAIREFIARTPDALLSDIGMPERDGYELIREIRRLAPSEGGAVPAIALTAFTRPQDRAQALGAGYQGHLAKPIQPHALVSEVARLTRREATGDELGDRHD